MIDEKHHGWDNPLACRHCDTLIYWNPMTDCWIHKRTGQQTCTWVATPPDDES